MWSFHSVLVLRFFGQSLIQTLIAVAIMSVAMLVFASMMNNQQRETVALTQKLAALDFQQALTRTFADGSVCNALLVTGAGGTVAFNIPGDGAGTTAKPASIKLALTSIPLSTTPGAPILAAQNSTEILSAISNSLVLVPAPQPAFQLINIVGSKTGAVGNYKADFAVNFDQTKLIRSVQPAKQM